MKKGIFIVFLVLSNIITAQGFFNKIRENVNRIYSQSEQKVREYSNKLNNSSFGERLREEVNSFRSESFDEWRNKIGNFTERISPKLKELYQDPYKLYDYQKEARRIIGHHTSTLIKNIPIYDPNRGEVVSFNSYCSRFIKNIGGDYIEGSELENDPVGTAVMLMMDDDYLLNAKLIPVNGHYISIEEMTKHGFSREQYKNVYNDYYNLKNKYQYRSADFGESFIRFNKKIKNIKPSPLGFLTNITINIPSPDKLFNSVFKEFKGLFNELGVGRDLSEYFALVSIVIIIILLLKLLWKIITLPFKKGKIQKA
jgi:hypothetical protein